MDKVKSFLVAVFAFIQGSTFAKYALAALVAVAVISLLLSLIGPVISGVVGGLVSMAAVYLVRKYGFDALKATVRDVVSKIKGFSA